MNRRECIQLASEKLSNQPRKVMDTYVLLLNYLEEKKVNLTEENCYSLINASSNLCNLINDIDSEGLDILSDSNDFAEYYEIMSELVKDDSDDFTKDLIGKTILPNMSDMVHKRVTKDIKEIKNVNAFN
ncbi:hypothetical protein [Clostridium perfringens]|uniref:hypothetical protein n=1 Tax=Clostridium perfringens TaxID=1502 RepID=UPI0024BCFFED|nr:hypothetical protein [Clostridium perfringens]